MGRDRGRPRAAALPAGAGGGRRPGRRGPAAGAVAVAAGPGRLGRPRGPGDHRHAGHRVTAPSPARVLVLWCPEWPVPPDPDSGRAFERVVSLVEELCPRVEVLWPGACAIGARGPARYFGGEEALAGKIIEAVTGGGSAGQAGIADGLFAAQLAARAAAPVTVVPPGQAREFLAPYPVSVLDGAGLDSGGMTELLPRLGIVTLGDLARLPASQAVNRFGVAGGIAHRLARGLDPRPLAARPPGRTRGVRRQAPRRADARRPRRPGPCLRMRSGAGDQRGRAGARTAVAARRAAVRAGGGRAGPLATGRLAPGRTPGPGRPPGPGRVQGRGTPRRDRP